MTEVLKIVTHTGCNLKCEYCFQNGWRDQYQMVMNDDTVESIFDKVRNHDYPLEMCVMGGETFFYPNLMRKFCEMHKKYLPKSKLTFFTNGTILNDEIIDIYDEYSEKILIVISMHNYTNQKYIESVIHHAKILESKHIEMNLVLILTVDADIVEFTKVIVKLLHHVKHVKLTFEYIPNRDFFTKDQLKYILSYFMNIMKSINEDVIRDKFFTSITRLFTMLGLNIDDSDSINESICSCRYLTCGAGTRELSILPNGDIAPCENAVHKIDRTKLININNISKLDDIYDYEFYRDLQHKYHSPILTESGLNCSECLLRGVCNECTCDYADRCHNPIYTKSDIRCQFTQDLAEVQLDYILNQSRLRLESLQNENIKLYYHLIERNTV